MDLVCFSHLRWNFVYQRPQHLLSRFAREGRVYYIEEPEFEAPHDHYNITKSKEGVSVVLMKLAGHWDGEKIIQRQKDLVDACLRDERIADYILWYYTPMALEIGDHLCPRVTVYDCMDELAAFKFAPPQIRDLENCLLEKADVVFTGGHSLYEAKKHQHGNIYPFPSSIDKDHFAQARQHQADPADQQDIPHPRLGFYGVIDERFDIGLIGDVAAQKPDWHFVLVGPVVKIDPETLPRLPNIHYLGGKSYDELPHYLGGWDIALISFMLNEHTRFISPTKTPEYLAGGKPVISSSIRDVVHPYGVNNLVHIADDAPSFIDAATRELATTDKQDWLARSDDFLKNNSWDETWRQMSALIDQKAADNTATQKEPA